MNPARTIRFTGALAFVATVPSAVLAGWGTPTWWAVPLLTIVVALGEVAVVHLDFGRQRWVFSCTDGAIAVALVLSPGAWMALAVMTGVLLAQLYRRMPPLKIAFNVAQFGLGTAAAASVAGSFDGAIAGACAGMAVFWLINHLLVAVAVAASSQRRLRGLLWTSAPLSAAHAAGNTSMGLLAAWLAVHAPLGLVGLIVPFGLLWSSYDQQTRRAAEARLFAELARGQEQATGRSVDLSAQVVVAAAARLFDGADVEMLLVTADCPVRYAGNEHGISSRRRVDAAAFNESWVLRTLGAGGVHTGVEDHRSYCAAALGDPEHPLAVLVARRPSGAAAFGRRETMLAQVLVGQAESWLSVADLAARHDDVLGRAEAADDAARALGHLGARTVPALAVLRESAGRLARLADVPLGVDSEGVDDIVDELHAVERAVASLLGAVSLAAERDLLSGPGSTAAAGETAAGDGVAGDGVAGGGVAGGGVAGAVPATGRGGNDHTSVDHTNRVLRDAAETSTGQLTEDWTTTGVLRSEPGR